MKRNLINSQGKEFHYYEYGHSNRKILLFLPGYADSGLMYDKLGKSLAKSYRLIALDLPMIYDGKNIHNLKSLTDFLVDFVTAININNFTIAGFSSCGLIAINYAYNYPQKIDKLILLNSVPRFILSKINRRLFRLLTPLLLNRPILFVYSRLNTSLALRRLLRLPKISSYTIDRMRNYYYSVFGTAINLMGESVLVRFKNAKVPKKIIFFKDDTIIPWARYQQFVEKLDCEVVVFSEGLHADKQIYWEKLKSLWLKNPKIQYQDMDIEKSQ